MTHKNSNGSCAISREEAIKLLLQTNVNYQSNDMHQCEYFDKYGNYFFSTDLVTNEPNTAYGSPNVFTISSFLGTKRMKK